MKECGEGNITRAADILHIAAPMLSRKLKDLENELKVMLFHRGNRKISLTDAGMLFQQRAVGLVTLLDKTNPAGFGRPSEPGERDRLHRLRKRLQTESGKEERTLKNFRVFSLLIQVTKMEVAWVWTEGAGTEFFTAAEDFPHSIRNGRSALLQTLGALILTKGISGHQVN